MPYNILGGDSPESTKWMESCVTNVMKTGKDKSSAVAICKVQYKKKNQAKAENDALSEESLRETMMKIEDSLMRLFRPAVETGPVRSVNAWVVDVFDTYVIAEIDNDYYKLDYTINGEDVVFSNPVKVNRKVVYEPAQSEIISNNRRIARNGIIR